MSNILEPVTTVLAQYGAIGVILALVLGLFLWAFKRLFDHVLNNSLMALQRLADAVEKLAARIDSQHNELLRRMGD